MNAQRPTEGGMTVKNANRIRTAGLLGMFGAVLFLVNLFVEYSLGLQPPGSGALYYANQGMFFIAMLCYVIVIVGLMWAKAAGDGWFGKISLGVFASGWTLLLAAEIVLLTLVDNPSMVLFPIGGLISMFGGLLAGIAVATAGRWHGWQRFAPLIVGLYFLLVLVVPDFVANREPNLLTESLWPVTWFLLGLALVTSGRAARDQSVRTQ